MKQLGKELFSIFVLLVASSAVLGTNALRLTEPLTEFRLPANALNEAVASALQAGNISFLKRWDGIQISGGGLITVGGEIEFPEHLLDFLGANGGGEKVLADIQISFRTSVRNDNSYSWAAIDFESIKVNSQEVIQTTPVVSNLVGFLFTQPAVLQWLSDSSKKTPAYADQQAKAPAGTKAEMLAYLKQQSLRFLDDTSTLMLKLDFEKFAAFFPRPKFKATASLVDQLQLWSFSPMKFDDSSETFFYMALGWGPPPAKWEQTLQRRLARDRQDDQIFQNHVRAKLPSAEEVYKQFQIAFENRRKDVKLAPLSVREQRALDHFMVQMKERITQTLRLGNPLFKASPQEEYDHMQQILTQTTVAFFEDLQHQQEVLKTMAQPLEQRGQKEKTTWPFMSQSLSQKTISEAIRFFRDIEIKDQSIFSSFYVLLNPALPGITIKGQLNTESQNLNALSGGKVGAPSNPQQLLGGRLPFELTLRLYMQPDGWLRIDPESLVLFKGSQALAMTSGEKTGRLIFNIVLHLIEKTLAPMILDVGPRIATEESGDQKKQDAERLRQYFSGLLPAYSKMMGASHHFDPTKALQLIDADLKGNPYLHAGKNYLQTQMKQLNAKDYIRRTDSRGLLIYPNPQLLALFVEPLEKGELHVWNAEPVYRPQYGKSYIDIAVGVGPRSDKYCHYLQTRDENLASQTFTIEEGHLKDSPDFMLGLNFTDVSTLIKIMLDAAKEHAVEAVEKALKEDKAQSQFLFNDMQISARGDDELAFMTDCEIIEKVKRSWFNPKRWLSSAWKVERIPLRIQLRVALYLDDISRYTSIFPPGVFPIFMGDKVIRLDFTEAGIITGRFRFGQKLLALAGLNVKDIDLKKSAIGRALKSMMVKKMGAMLDDKKNIGNTMLRGVPINKYVRIYTHGSEILIQLNPRMVSPAFEATLTSLGSKPIRIDAKRNSLQIGFRTRAVMANADKTEILQIMRRLQEAFSPYFMVDDKGQLLNLLGDNALFNSVLLSADKGRPSLFDRFLRLLRRYPEVGQFAKVANNRMVNQMINGEVDQNERDPQEALDRALTETGAELIYFLCAAMTFHRELGGLISQIESLKALEAAHYQDLVSYRDDIKKGMIDPLWTLYKMKHLARNQAIAKQEISSWTENFYSEAVFANVLSEMFAAELK